MQMRQALEFMGLENASVDGREDISTPTKNHISDCVVQNLGEAYLVD